MPPKKPLFIGDWYPWYVDAAMNSERVDELNLAEYGAYRKALDIQWKRGWMPSDPKKFASAIGKKCTMQIARKVMQFFANVRGSKTKVRNHTLEIIRSEQSLAYTEKVQRAKHAAAKRWEKKHLELSPSNAQALPKQSHEREKRLDKKRLDKDNIKREESDLFLAICDRSESAVAHSQNKKDFALAFLETLREEPSFTHCDVDEELDKATAWATKHNRKVTPKSFFNWLTRIDPPIITKATAAGGTRNGTEPRDFYREREQRKIDERANIERIRREVEEHDRKLSKTNNPDG